MSSPPISLARAPARSPSPRVLPQDEYSLTPIWNVAGGGAGSLITATGGGSPFQRTIGYNQASNHLYVVSRVTPTSASNYVVRVLDASTGDLLGSLNTNGIYNAGAVGEGGVGLV